MMNILLSHILSPQRFAAAIIFLSLLLTVCSCSDDDDRDAGKATVKMTFTTRASVQADGNTTLAPRERMKTLRVIMENAETGKILYNVFYDNLVDVTSKTITFHDVPVKENVGTPFNFYAIANERSFLGTDESLDGKDVDLKVLYERDIDVDFNSEANKDLPIPQAKKNQKLIMPIKGTQAHIVQLEFPVAKVCVNFSNEIETEQTVSNIKMPGLMVTGGKLFPQDFTGDGQTELQEPTPEAGTSATDVAFVPNPLTVPVGTYGGSLGEKSVTPLYVYPAKGSAYTLKAVWNGDKSVGLNQKGELSNGICRGMQLNIGIKLKYGVLQLENLQVTVDNWSVNKDSYITPDFQ